jgi:hypothetical protein
MSDASGASAVDRTGQAALMGAAWCAAITLASFLWAKTLYNRNPAAPLTRTRPADTLDRG